MKFRSAGIAIAVPLTFLWSTLAFGQTIQFNRYFMCNGERVAVENCFDDSDSAKCSVDYPDRPLHNGILVPVTETHGEVVAKIKSCVGPAATLASVPSLDGFPAARPQEEQRPSESQTQPAGKKKTGPLGETTAILLIFVAGFAAVLWVMRPRQKKPLTVSYVQVKSPPAAADTSQSDQLPDK